MKHLNKTLLVLSIALITLASCKQNEVQPSPLTSLNVTNAVVGGSTLVLNGSLLSVSNNSSAPFTLDAGQSPIKLYPAATPATLYYNQTISTNKGDYYSLFLAGASPAAVDAVLIKDNYTNYTDSICAVRFINLSPNSSPVSVNITGSANGSEVSSLAYKAITDFKQYPAKKSNTSYAFQIRDAATGTLIVSTTLTTPRFHNVTLVLRGLVSGSPAVGITTVSYN